jgi:ubiquitin-like protein Pup
MAQEQTKRGGGGGEDDDLTGSTAAGQERREKLAEETDDLLDEIDSDLAARAAGLPVTPTWSTFRPRGLVVLF